MTFPWLAATERRMVMISSREKITTTTHAATRPAWTSTISTERTKSLSASGSRNLPKSLTDPLRRASSPSSVSVSEKRMKRAAAIWSCPGKLTSRSAIRTGMATRRLTVSAFGTFIPKKFAPYSMPSRSSNSSTSGSVISTSRDFEPWYPPMTRCSASWSTMRPARE